MDNNELLNSIFLHVINILLVIVILLGYSGNFLCFKIFLSSKLKKYPISLYFRAISVFDSVMLIEAFLYYATINYGFNIKYVNDFFCKLKIYFFLATGPISGWLMVAVSIDRFMSIAYPTSFQIVHSFPTQLIITSFVVIYNYSLYSFMIWNSVLEKGKLKKSTTQISL